MPFTPGHKLSKGRVKGSKNKSSIPLEEKAQELGVNPFEILLLFAAGNWEKLGYKSETVIKYGKDVQNEEFVIDPAVRARAAAEACQYLYPKLKAIEHSGSIDSNIEGEVQISIVMPDNGRSEVK